MDAPFFVFQRKLAAPLIANLAHLLVGDVYMAVEPTWYLAYEGWNMAIQTSGRL